MATAANACRNQPSLLNESGVSIWTTEGDCRFTLRSLSTESSAQTRMQASSQYGIELTSSKLPSLDLAFPTGNQTRTRTERLIASRCLAIERTVVCTRIPQPRARLGPGLPTKQGPCGKSAARITSLAGSQSQSVVCSVEYNEATTGSYCFTSFRPQTREMPSTTKSHGAIGTDWARIIMTASSHLSYIFKGDAYVDAAATLKAGCMPAARPWD